MRTALSIILLPLLCACAEDGLTVLTGALETTARIEFGDIALGDAKTKALVLKNTGEIAIEIRTIETESHNALTVSLSATEMRLLPGQEKTVDITARPLDLSEEPITLQLTVKTDLPNAPLLHSTLHARGVAWLEFQPAFVDFGDVLLDTNRTLEVLAINRTSAPIELSVNADAFGQAEILLDSSTSLAGTFHLEGNLGSTGLRPLTPRPLMPHQGHKLRLRYRPSSVTLRDRGRLQLFKNASEEPAELTMLGRGAQGALLCTPNQIALGDVPPGRVTQGSTACTNITTRNIELTQLELREDSHPAFGLLENNTPLILTAGETIDIAIRFDPAEAAPSSTTFSGVLIIDTQDQNTPLRSVGIELSARRAAPDIQVLPAHLDIGRVQLGQSATRRLLVENIGAAPLALSSARVEDTDLITAGALPSSLVPGGSALLDLTFTPISEGRVQARLLIESNDPDTPTRTVTLSAEGIDLPPCQYTLTPGRIAFGVQALLRRATSGAVIENIGDNACLVRDLEIENDPSGAFSLIDPPSPDVLLAPQAQMRLTVAYQPLETSEHNGLLAFTVSDPANPRPRVPLSGVTGIPQLFVFPDELNFGALQPGCRSLPKTIELLNTSAVPVEVLGIEVSGTSTSAFGFEPSIGGSLLLQPEERYTIDVRFNPQRIARELVTLRIAAQIGGTIEERLVTLLGDGTNRQDNEDRFTQAASGKTDVLFVIDNSRSMLEEQMRLIENIETFINTVQSQAFAYQLAVLSTDMSTAGASCHLPVAQRPPGTPEGGCGYFAQGNATTSDPDWRVINPDEQPSPQLAFTTVAQMGESGSAVEEGLEATYRALSEPLISGWNTGFLRPDAQLGLIFISDEDDQSTRSVDFYISAFRAFKGARAQHLLAAAGIIADPAGCNIIGSASSRYIEVINALRGELQSICTNDWSATLEAIARHTAGLRSRFVLSQQAIPSSVRVWIDGVPEAPVDSGPSPSRRWRYDPTVGEVIFEVNAIPVAGSQIVIRHQPACF